MTAQPSDSKLAHLILDKALDRELDGVGDRLTSVALALLATPEHQTLGREMVRGMFARTQPRKDRMTVPYPQSTVAMVAERQLPAKHATTLWQAIPTDHLLGVISSMLNYSIMKLNGVWANTARRALVAKIGQPGFETHKIPHVCGGITRDMIPLYGFKPPDDVLESSAWKHSLPWLLQQQLASVDYLFLVECEWLHIAWKTKPLR